MVKNKMAVINVLSSLVRNPLLLVDEHYPLTPDDFPERFHKIVFAAIDHLGKSGVKDINEIVIDDYLSHYPKQYQVFTDNRGMDYILQAMELSNQDNFDYYYQSLKKCSLLNDLQSKGFDISEFYNPDLVHVNEQQELQEKLDSFTLDEILSRYDMSLAELKSRYCSNSDVVECHISQGMRGLKEELARTPEFGLPMNSAKMTTICHGRRLKKLYLKAMSTGMGKTRLSVADACRIAVPEFYDPEKKQWVKTNCRASVLFITTELEVAEIQTMLWAYIACVPEDHIIDNHYERGEEARVEKAISLVESSDFYTVYISNFDIDDIENIIKRHKLQHNISYVFYDYLASTAKIFAETSSKTKGAVRLREDQVLMMLSERLKALCNRYNIHIDTSTQTNDDWKSQKNPDQSVIRGAKSIADKVDIGYIGLEPSERDKVAIQNIMTSSGMGFCKQPNLVYHVFKVRRGKTNHVKVFVHFDYGTLRTTDLFVTDRDYNLVNVTNTNVEMLLEDTEVEPTTVSTATEDGNSDDSFDY